MQLIDRFTYAVELFIFIGCISFVLVGCTSPEERARLVAEREARDHAKHQEISEFFNLTYPQRLLTFEYDGRAGEIVAFDFIRDIGGQLVDRGNAEFTLEVDYDRDSLGRDRYRQVFEVKIIDNDAPNRSRWVIMASRYERSCFQCRDMRLSYLRQALLALE